MTAGSTERPERLTRDNVLLLLVDHQIGLYTGTNEIDIQKLMRAREGMKGEKENSNDSEVNAN
jgi:hypothetical protein